METKNFLKTRKIDSELTSFKKYCKCGHSMVIVPTSKKNKVMCTWCGAWIYKNKLEEFKDKMTISIIKEERK